MTKCKILLILLLLNVSLLQAENTTRIYVSVNGSDLSTGSYNEPFQTIERARDEIRKLKKKGTDTIFRVVISGGKYFTDHPIVLTAEDSGADKTGIVYEAVEGETVRVIGGVEVSPSAFVNLGTNDPCISRIISSVRKRIKVLDLEGIGIEETGNLSRRGYRYRNGPSPMELSINNQTMQLARYPNNGYVKSGESVNDNGFTYITPNPNQWLEEKDAWTLGYWSVGWAEFYSPIESIDTLQKTIKIDNWSEGKKSFLTEIKNNRNWCGINILAELDVPGEYYIDRQNNRLYIYPPENIDFHSCEIMLSVIGEAGESLIEASGLKNVTFRNLILEKSRFGALSANNCENIVIDHCIFRNTGNTSVRLSGKNIRITNSEIFDSGAGGLTVDGGNRKELVSGDILVENCHIHHFGLWNRTYVPGVAISGVGTTVRNCMINDCPHSAILFGGNNHLIELNEIFNSCFETDDAGAIYTGRDWALHGTIIRYNYFHDIKSNSLSNEIEAHQLGVHAIYLDDCASGLTVFGNVFNNISGRAIMCGGGRDNKISNNIIVNCGAAHFTDRRGIKRITDIPGNSWNLKEKVEKLNYTHPPFSTAYPSLAKLMDDGYEKAKEPMGCEIVNNIGFNNRLWLEKNCLGACGGFDLYYFEGNMENADPLFVDESNLLKGVSKKSPIYQIKGFNAIQFEKIGLKE